MGLGEQRAVPEPAPLGDVHDVEGPFRRSQPVEQRPGRCRHPCQRGLVGRTGNDGLEGDPETRIERAGLLHEPHIRGVAVDEGDHHVMALLREEPRHVVVSGANAPVLDRTKYVRCGNADSLHYVGPDTTAFAEVRVECLDCDRLAISLESWSTAAHILVRPYSLADAKFSRRIATSPH